MAKKAAAIDPEIIKCAISPSYFSSEYGQILDSVEMGWIKFSLFPFQVKAIDTFHKNKQVVVLKSRQLGYTWLAAAYALWSAIFQPIQTILVFSKDEESAKKFLVRIKGMWERLPDKLRLAAGLKAGLKENEHIWEFSNGSTIQSFTSSGKSGRGDTGTLAILDESDWMENFEDLIVSVRPTVTAGGRMILMSTIDKSKEKSGFRGIFLGATAGRNEFTPVFSPWTDHPHRDEKWYQKEFDIYSSMLGSLDAGRDRMWQEYPKDIFQALSPNSTDKRLRAEWLQQCFIGIEPMEQLPSDAPSIPGLKIYHLPERNPLENKVFYIISGDPALGNPNSNDSALTVLRRDTGEEVACLWGKIEPTVFAMYIDQIGRYYNNAEVMVESNNHGLTVLTWLQEHSGLTRLRGHNKKIGWDSSLKGKIILYNVCADAFRNGEVLLHTETSLLQLSNVEGNTGKAPDEGLDDLADSVALALAGILASLGRSFVDDIKPEINYYTAIPRAMTEMDSFMMEDQDRDRDDDQEISYSEIVENMIF